jgi:hypothetical protein
MRQSHRLSLILVAAVVTLACLPTLGPEPLPTFDANAPLTAIVLTAGAAATQTALNAPPTATSTPLPTHTPTDTPTPTPTFLFFVPTGALDPTQIPLGVSQHDFDCQVLSAEPKGFVGVSTRFFGRWVVANIGVALWDLNSLDYRYTGGEKIHLQSIYDFPATVTPGATVELRVDMQSPAVAGTYTTNWKIYRGNNRSFCDMELTITVK